MNIYKRNQLHRMVAKMICTEVMANENYTFADTGYCAEDDLGTIAMENNETHTRGFIRYRLETSYHTDDAKLVKETENFFYKTEKYARKKDVILNLYTVDDQDKVFTDDKDYATKAREKRDRRAEYRYSLTEPGLAGSHPVRVGTKLYEKLFNEVSKVKPVKYGSPIAIYIIETKKTKYDYNTNKKCTEREVCIIDTSIKYTYRGRSYFLDRNKIEYNL